MKWWWLYFQFAIHVKNLPFCNAMWGLFFSDAYENGRNYFIASQWACMFVRYRAHIHREKRKFLRTALKELAIVFTDQPGLLGPKVLLTVWWWFHFATAVVAVDSSHTWLSHHLLCGVVAYLLLLLGTCPLCGSWSKCDVKPQDNCEQWFVSVMATSIIVLWLYIVFAACFECRCGAPCLGKIDSPAVHLLCGGSMSVRRMLQSRPEGTVAGRKV